jgi:hypothetical protein
MTIRIQWFHTIRRRAARHGLAAAAALAVASILPAGCTNAQLDGTSSSYLIVDSLLAASGAKPQTFGGTLSSDVLTNGSIISDLGEVAFQLGLKDPGAVNGPTRPTTANYITVTQYHVEFGRAGGRNTPGVDVPYAFDGAVTVTVSNTGGTATLTLVRVQAKAESPLAALKFGGGAGVISTIAKVTFYGVDQTGRPVTATASIGVDFADWADPE